MADLIFTNIDLKLSDSQPDLQYFVGHKLTQNGFKDVADDRGRDRTFHPVLQRLPIFLVGPG